MLNTNLLELKQKTHLHAISLCIYDASYKIFAKKI